MHSRSYQLTQFFSPAVQMRSYRTYGQLEQLGDLLITALFLMIKHQDGPFRFRKLQKLVIHGLPELFLRQRGLGIRHGIGKVLDPLGILILFAVKDRRGDILAFLAPPLPLILGNVYDDAVEIGGNLRIAAKVLQATVEPEKDLLRQVLHIAAAGKAQQGTEDAILLRPDDLFEFGGGLQDQVRLQYPPKVSSGGVKLLPGGAV